MTIKHCSLSLTDCSCRLTDYIKYMSHLMRKGTSIVRYVSLQMCAQPLRRSRDLSLSEASSISLYCESKQKGFGMTAQIRRLN